MASAVSRVYEGVGGGTHDWGWRGAKPHEAEDILPFLCKVCSYVFGC